MISHQNIVKIKGLNDCEVSLGSSHIKLTTRRKS